MNRFTGQTGARKTSIVRSRVAQTTKNRVETVLELPMEQIAFRAEVSKWLAIGGSIW